MTSKVSIKGYCKRIIKILLADAVRVVCDLQLAAVGEDTQTQVREKHMGKSIFSGRLSSKRRGPTRSGAKD